MYYSINIYQILFKKIIVTFRNKVEISVYISVRQHKY